MSNTWALQSQAVIPYIAVYTGQLSSEISSGNWSGKKKEIMPQILSFASQNFFMRHVWEEVQMPCFCNPYILNNFHSLAAQEQPVQPEPSQHQHDEGDGETEQKPGSKIHHFSFWVLAVN